MRSAFLCSALSALSTLALGACQRDPKSPSASGESHFLSACTASAECTTGLGCLCGLCTVACSDDAECEAAESGAVCSEDATCEAGQRTCTRADGVDAGPRPGCVAPKDGTCPADFADAFRGARLDRERQCRGPRDEVVSCRHDPFEQGVLLCRRRVADGAEFFLTAGTCLPGEWTECEGEPSFTGEDWPECPAGVPSGACQPRELGLTVTPLPAADTGGAIQSVSVRPDALDVVVIVDGGAEATYTFTGPFGNLDPTALNGLDHLGIVVRDGAPGDFMATLRGCNRPRLVLLNGTRGLLERMFGPVDVLFDPDVTCDPELPIGSCPREYMLRWDGQTIPPGGQVMGLTSEYRAGRVEGCAGDPAAAARVELAALPRANIPTCPGAGEPGTTDPAFTLTNDAGHLYQPVDDRPVEVTIEVAATPDPADPTHLTLVPLSPTAAFGTLHLRATVGVPTPLVAPVMLHVFAHVPWHVNRVVEISDASGLRFAGASSDPGGLGRFSHLQGTRLASTCLMPWDSGVIAFTPLTLRRDGDTGAVDVAALGLSAPDGAGVRVDVRASGDYLDVCVTDNPSGWLSFAARWDFDCSRLADQPCATQWDACCPRNEATTVCLPGADNQLTWQRPPEGVICTCLVEGSPQTTATCEAL